MLSGPSQGKLVVCGQQHNVSFDVGQGMPRRKQIVKVSFDVGEGRLRREQQMEEIRMRSLEMLYRLWYDRVLESSPIFSLDTMKLADFASMHGEVSDEIWSEDVNLQLHATTQIDKLLSIERESPTTLVKKGVVRRFVHFLARDGFLDLQYEAAWALIKIFGGTCGKTKSAAIREAVPSFVRLLDSPSDDVCELAVFALGIVAHDSPNYGNLVLSNGVLVPLLNLLKKHVNLGKHAKLSMLRNVTWTLRIFCECISERSYKQVKPFLTTLGRLLHSDDLEVLINSCWAIRGLSYDRCGKIHALMEAGLCPKLVKHLIHSDRRVQIPVLMTVYLIPFEETHIQAVIDNGALGHLLTLLTEDPEYRRIRREACRVISGILRGNECQIQAVIDAKLLSPLVALLESPDEDLQKGAAYAIRAATSGGSQKQIEYLVYECKIINPTCNLLSSPDPITVKLALQVVDNVLEAGRSKRSDVCPTSNPYTQLIVEAQAVEKIAELEDRLDYETYLEAEYILNRLGYRDEFVQCCL